jgi:hypothetical protein
MSVAATGDSGDEFGCLSGSTPAGYGLPGGAQVGWGISEVMAAFVASLAGNRGRGLAPELSQDSLGRVPQGRKDVGGRCTIYRALLLRLRLCDWVTVVVADGLWWGYLR